MTNGHPIYHFINNNSSLPLTICQANLAAPNIPASFPNSATTIAIFDDPNILNYEDTRFNYGETRFVSIGQIILVTQEKTVIIVVIHTQRNQTIRLISARKANERERKRYERQ